MSNTVEKGCQYCANWDRSNQRSSFRLACRCKKGRGYKEPDEGKDCRDASPLPKYEFKEHNSPCFITTAVVNMCGFNDDCRVITNLRVLREELQDTEQGQELLKMYDVIGPVIASKLSEEEEQLLTGYKIISEDLIPTAFEVEKQDFNSAANRYLDMIKRLANRYDILIDSSKYAYDQDIMPNQMGHGTARVHKKNNNA